MDPTKNYIKLAGQPVQEIEVVDAGEFGAIDILHYRSVPPPEQSLAAETLKKLKELSEKRAAEYKEKYPRADKFIDMGEIVLSDELRIALEIVDTKLKALKE